VPCLFSTLFFYIRRQAGLGFRGKFALEDGDLAPILILSIIYNSIINHYNIAYIKESMVLDVLMLTERRVCW
jgi:hypothetical protein